MKKQRLIFVHGGQGCGKSTITNLLREGMLHTTLMRLAGVPSTQTCANVMALNYHLAMLQAVQLSKNTGMNFVFDRSFLCEKVYANLGFKPHDFKFEMMKLNHQLNQLANDYEVWFVLLTASEEALMERLNREGKPQFEGVAFDPTNSLRQQQEYQNEFLKLPSSVKTLVMKTDHLTPNEVANYIIELTKGE